MRLGLLPIRAVGFRVRPPAWRVRPARFVFLRFEYRCLQAGRGFVAALGEYAAVAPVPLGGRAQCVGSSCVGGAFVLPSGQSARATHRGGCSIHARFAAEPVRQLAGRVLHPSVFGFAWRFRPVALAAIIGTLTFLNRIRGVYFTILSQALAYALATFMIGRQEYFGGSNGLTNFTTIFGHAVNSPDTKKALLAGKHVLCESPVALKKADCEELYSIAEEHGLVLMDAIKTAYSTAYERLVLLAKSGKIGKVVSVDAVCTSLRDGISIAGTDLTQKWKTIWAVLENDHFTLYKDWKVDH